MSAAITFGKPTKQANRASLSWENTRSRLRSKKPATIAAGKTIVQRSNFARSVPRPLAGRFGLRHPLRHLSFHGIEVETGATLHRRILDERFEFLRHHFLDENKPPELVLEPIEILLTTFLRAVVWPAVAFE